MIVSIIVCTCNRAEHLRQTLAAMAGVCVPESMPTELIVVDNASTDETVEVVQQCRLPNVAVRYLHEPRQGQCYARNTGIAAAEGDVILFTDDDVRPPKNWIEVMCQSILSGDGEATAGGVKFAPHLERDWMRTVHKLWLAHSESIPFPPDRMVGANMAFSRAVLEKVPRFDTELGPGALGFYDEGLFCYQLLAAGYKIASALDVCVEHHFDESRLLASNFAETAKKMGRSAAYVAYHWKHENIPAAGKYALKRPLRLAYMRAQKWAGRRREQTISEEELQLIHDIYFYRQYLIERKRPRNYEKLGLRKLQNVG